MYESDGRATGVYESDGAKRPTYEVESVAKELNADNRFAQMLFGRAYLTKTSKHAQPLM